MRSIRPKEVNIGSNTHNRNTFFAGDDGGAEKSETAGFMKESENIFTLWCSGRTCCEGMLVELKLIKVCLLYITYLILIHIVNCLFFSDSGF